MFFVAAVGGAVGSEERGKTLTGGDKVTRNIIANGEDLPSLVQ